MADADIAVKVSIETAVHAALREMLQSIYDNNGLRIDEIRVAWLCIDRMNENDAMLTDLQITSTTNQTGRPHAG